MKKQRGFTVYELILGVIYFILLPGGAIGWCLNVYKVATSDVSILTGMLIVRIIGIPVAPLGAVMGYL